MSSPSRCSQDHHWAEHRRGHLLVIRRLSSGHPFNHRPSGHLYQRYASPPPQRCPRLPRLHRWQSLLVRLRPKSVFWCSRPRKADGNHLFTPVTQHWRSAEMCTNMQTSYSLQRRVLYPAVVFCEQELKRSCSGSGERGSGEDADARL